MKNLKKILALVLAFACAFTMFAGAAFTDQADIKVENEVVVNKMLYNLIQLLRMDMHQHNQLLHFHPHHILLPESYLL